VRVSSPIHVEADGLLRRRHCFVSGDQVLGELGTEFLSRESIFSQADGQRFVIRTKSRISAVYRMHLGEIEWATAERFEISYRAVPYYLRRTGPLGAYQLRNAQDAVVLEITMATFPGRRTEIEMVQAADLPLVVLAYFLVRRRAQHWRRRVGSSR
jgi:hypothetical protein